jgi:hypothetical protein
MLHSFSGTDFWNLLDRLWGPRSAPPRLFRGELGDFPTFMVALAEYLATAAPADVAAVRERFRRLAARLDATSEPAAFVGVALGRAMYERLARERILLAFDPTAGALAALLAFPEDVAPATLPDGIPTSSASR